MTIKRDGQINCFLYSLEVGKISNQNNVCQKRNLIIVIVKEWNLLLQDILKFLYMEAFKNGLDKYLSGLVQV